MKMIQKTLALAALVTTLAATPAAASSALKDISLGKDTAPVTIIEYASFTCSHCSDFYIKVMSEIEKNYVETGKVRFIFRDFPTDAISLKASALSHCMPEAQYYPFVKLLFNNYSSWINSSKPVDTLINYAQMAGLEPEKARACVDDTKMMDALAERRTQADEKYGVNATPTLIINDGQEKVVGARTYNEYATIFDKHLAKKK